MTYEQIATFYRTRMGIQSERSVKQLAEFTRFIQRKKGDRLRVAGEEMTSILFLMNGVARTYVIDDYFGTLSSVFTFEGDTVELKMSKVAEWFLDEYVGTAEGAKT